MIKVDFREVKTVEEFNEVYDLNIKPFWWGNSSKCIQNLLSVLISLSCCDNKKALKNKITSDEKECMKLVKEMSLIFNQWDRVILNKKLKTPVKCSCGHHIYKVFLVENVLNGNCIPIGSVCILQDYYNFSEDLISQVKLIEKLERKKEREQRQTALDVTSGKIQLNKDNLSDYISGLEKIASPDEIKTLCHSCFKLCRKEEDKLRCSVCKKVNRRVNLWLCSPILGFFEGKNYYEIIEMFNDSDFLTKIQIQKEFNIGLKNGLDV